jgi:hypothetical protein
MAKVPKRMTKALRAWRDSVTQTWNDTWETVMTPAIKEAMTYLRDSKKRVPKTLLHFTDAGGAVGILRNKHLRIVRSRSSNDPMELEYGLDIARKCITALKGDEWTSIFKEEMLNCFDSRFLGKPQEYPDPHICCFSLPRAEEDIPQWALYGRKGAGLALVFGGPELAAKERVDLVKVVYSPARQFALIRSTLRIAMRACADGRVKLLQRQGRHSDLVRTTRFYAHAFGNIVVLHAAVMKRPKFKFEQEWRFVVSYMDIDTNEPQLNFDMVASGDIMKTFFELPITEEDLKGVIVGPTSAKLNRPVVRMMLEQLKFDAKKVFIREGKSELRG